MNLKFTFPDTVPLRYDAMGTIRVTGSRVSLDTLVGCFKRGDTMAEIAEGFPSVSEHINAVIDWYLNHQDEAEQYLEQQEIEAERIRREIIEAQPGYAEWREELRRRWAQRQLSKT